MYAVLKLAYNAGREAACRSYNVKTADALTDQLSLVASQRVSKDMRDKDPIYSGGIVDRNKETATNLGKVLAGLLAGGISGYALSKGDPKYTAIGAGTGTLLSLPFALEHKESEIDA